jgi:hypothetical protein
VFSTTTVHRSVTKLPPQTASVHQGADPPTSTSSNEKDGVRDAARSLHPGPEIYESVSPNLVLKPGTYFPLFAAQDEDGGFLLTDASIPFSYKAGSTTLGFLDPTTPSWRFTANTFGAVRILGHPVVQ